MKYRKKNTEVDAYLVKRYVVISGKDAQVGDWITFDSEGWVDVWTDEQFQRIYEPATQDSIPVTINGTPHWLPINPVIGPSANGVGGTTVYPDVTHLYSEGIKGVSNR